MKYKCTYVSGSGTEYDGGIWEKKETPKTITFILIEQPFFEVDYTLLKFKKVTKNLSGDEITYHGYGSVLKDWEDGTYTAYPNQCGTPYIFEPIKEKE
jgi:hypothetical protein